MSAAMVHPLPDDDLTTGEQVSTVPALGTVHSVLVNEDGSPTSIHINHPNIRAYGPGPFHCAEHGKTLDLNKNPHAKPDTLETP